MRSSQPGLLQENATLRQCLFLPLRQPRCWLTTTSVSFLSRTAETPLPFLSFFFTSPRFLRLQRSHHSAAPAVSPPLSCSPAQILLTKSLSRTLDRSMMPSNFQHRDSCTYRLYGIALAGDRFPVDYRGPRPAEFQRHPKIVQRHRRILRRICTAFVRKCKCRCVGACSFRKGTSRTSSNCKMRWRQEM